MTIYHLENEVRFDNKTRKYLAPCLQEHKGIVPFLTTIKVVSYVLIHNQPNKVFAVSKNWVKNEFSVIDIPLGDWVNGKLHLSGYEINEHIYRNFIKSRYSEMYSQKEIEKYFNFTDARTELVRNVLTKDEDEMDRIAEQYNVARQYIVELDGKIKREEEFLELDYDEKCRFVYNSRHDFALEEVF